MKKLTIRKLILLSQTEGSSAAIDFSDGLNIIIGGNKTGKSSVIKSIFYTLGCKLKIEKDWLALIDKYAVQFSYGKKHYLVVRVKDEFDLFETDRKLEQIKAIKRFEKTDSDQDKFHMTLMHLLGVNMTWVTVFNKIVQVTPSHIFSFHYVDQDSGWRSIAGSFTHDDYVQNWKEEMLKYVVGFQGEDYYSSKTELDRLRLEVKGINKKIDYIREFVGQIGVEFDENNVEPNDNVEGGIDFQVKSVFEKISTLQRANLNLTKEIEVLGNERYNLYKRLEVLKNYEIDLIEDHKFASKLPDEVTCPTCGVIHKNTVIEKASIVAHIQSCHDNTSSLRRELKILDDNIEVLTSTKLQNMRQLRVERIEYRKLQKETDVLERIKNFGKRELVSKSQGGLASLVQERLDTRLRVEEQTRALERYNSESKRKEIVGRLKENFKEVLAEVGVRVDRTKLRGFRAELTQTGSELPRVIYSYYAALYTLVMENGLYPFKFLVIDTPNQQGQDDIKLGHIFKTFGRFTSNKGQVIIGTERENGV